MYCYVHLPFSDMREQPAAASKVASQALFGERVQVHNRSGDWLSITTPDGYAGWIQSAAVVTRQEPYPKDLEITRLSAHIYSLADTEYGPLMTLPHGSHLQLIDSSDPRWHKIRLPNGQDAFIQKGDVYPHRLETWNLDRAKAPGFDDRKRVNIRNMDPFTIVESRELSRGSKSKFQADGGITIEPFDLASFSKKFLGLPYTWGGRSSFGYDCSGFIQMLYGRLGIQLPRDARQQILDQRGEPVAFKALVLGDLIFWGLSEREIKHVGMFLEGEQFIHTSTRENQPYLRISKLTDFEWNGAKSAFYPFRTARRMIITELIPIRK